MIIVVELGGEEERVAGNTRSFDAIANLILVAVCSGGVDMLVAIFQSILDSVGDLAWSGLPRSYERISELMSCQI